MAALKYTYLKGSGHIWRVVLPKMTEAEAAVRNIEVGYEYRRLKWTGERIKRGKKNI